MLARHGNLTANKVTTIELGELSTEVVITVVNVTQDAPFYIRLDGKNPTVRGDDCRVVMGARRLPARAEAWDGSVVSEVRIISEQDGLYAVEVGR